MTAFGGPGNDEGPEESDANDPTSEWGNPDVRGEPRYQAALALLVAIVLYLTLPQKLVVGHGPVARWWLPVLEAALMVPVWLSEPKRYSNEARWQRMFAIGLTAVLSIANIASLLLLVDLLVGGSHQPGKSLLFYALQIWATNVIVFSLWYWELDRGGPGARLGADHRNPDFLFAQMTNPGSAPRGWVPTFIDYLYVSFTNATAFSPTDTLPLTATAKSLMLVQSLASLLTVGLVAARAVNILA